MILLPLLTKLSYFRVYEQSLYTMDTIFYTGLLLVTGFFLGELALKVSLPKVSGYIIAGILLNTEVTGIIPTNFTESTEPLINIALAVITFAIGGSLSFKSIRKSGKMIVTLTLFESLFAYFFAFIFLFAILYYTNLVPNMPAAISVSLILASLAAPTDPSATLAVSQQYKAKGVLSSTVLGIAAFDDIAGIILYTITIVAAKTILGGTVFSAADTGLELLQSIGGSIAIGLVFGFIFNQVTKLIKKETEGTLIVHTLGSILLCYGIADFFKTDALLATMALGMMVINYNPLRHKIFELIERYTEELIFVIFFTLSGLHLELSALAGSFGIIIIYVIGRSAGKFTGIYTGAKLTKAPDVIRKYAFGGLFPQGGIVIGLALIIGTEPIFEPYASTIIGVVIGSAVIHELLGPVLARISLKKAGEIE